MAIIEKEDVDSIEDAPLFAKFLRQRGIRFKQSHFVLGYMYEIRCSVENRDINFFVDELLFLSGAIPIGYLCKQADPSHFTNHFKEGDYLTHEKVPQIFKYIEGAVLRDFMSWRMEHCL